MSKTAQKILRIQKQPPAPTLFLGNLGFETTDKSIRELFEAHRGVKKKDPAAEDEDDRDRDAATDKDAEKPEVKDKWIRKIRMGTFEDTGNCKGCVALRCVPATTLAGPCKIRNRAMLT